MLSKINIFFNSKIVDFLAINVICSFCESRAAKKN